MLVYCIKNKINDKEYIGLTKRPLESRWKQHVYESNKVNSWEWNTPLGNAIKKYGKDNFEIYVLNNYNSVEEMKLGEIEMIEERKSLSVFGGYNLSKGGDGRLGVKLSDETKRKIGLGQIGKIMSPESKIKMSESRIGYKYSEETKKKMSEAWTKNPERRVRQRLAYSGSGNPNYKEGKYDFSGFKPFRSFTTRL